METWLDLAMKSLFALTALLLFKKYQKFKEFAAKVDAIPGRKKLPILGNLFDFVDNRSRIFEHVTDDLPKLGPVVRAWLLNKAQIMITSARVAEPILKNPLFNNKSDTYSFLHDWLGLGLITAPESKWRIHRKILTPAFHLGILQEYLPIFNKHFIRLTQKLEKMPELTQGFDMLEHASITSLDVICESSMGVELNNQDDSHREYVHALNSVLDLIIGRYFTPWLYSDLLYRLSPTKRAMDKHINVMKKFMDKVIDERRSYFNGGQDKSGGVPRRRGLCFLDVLLTAERDGVIDQKQIKDQVATFMFTGYDSVSTSGSYVLYLLGTYPEIQSRVVSELDRVFGCSGRCPDTSDLGNLKYLERCIKETLRLYPVAPFFERNVPKDVQAGKYLIPSGCKVSFNTYTLHRDPEFWPDPEKFDPDRFLPENSEGRHPYAYLPFSAGPRNCIGQKFAMLEEKIFLSTVLRRFRVEAVQKRNQLKFKAGIVLNSETGIQLRLFDRVTHPNLRVSSTST